MAMFGQATLVVDFAHLQGFDDELARALESNYYRCEKALRCARSLWLMRCMLGWVCWTVCSD